MSPFAVFLGELRLRSNLRQHGLAVSLGYKQAAYFESLNETIDAGTATARLALHRLSALAGFERHLIIERPRVGLNVARRQGNKGERKSAHQAVKRVLRLMTDRTSRPADIATHSKTANQLSTSSFVSSKRPSLTNGLVGTSRICATSAQRCR